MKEFTIKANVVRAAQAFQSKKDCRSYLNGVFIGKNKTIVGADGAAVFISTHYADIDDDYIIQISGVIPQSAETLEFILIDDTGDALIHCFDRKGKKIKVIYGCLLEGKYPDVTRLIPDFSEAAMSDLSGVNDLCFQAKYMAKCEKLFSKNKMSKMKITFSGNLGDPIVAEFFSDYPEGTKVLIMKAIG